jgi:hypothetical protein
MKSILGWIAVYTLGAAALPVLGSAQEARPGGYAPASETETNVVEAAAFAIKAQEKSMGERDAKPVKLALIKIASVQKQVVAGLNYRLQLKVNLNGQEKEAEAVVWWQAWRKPDPYQLTSWIWK